MTGREKHFAHRPRFDDFDNQQREMKYRNVEYKPNFDDDAKEIDQDEPRNFDDSTNVADSLFFIDRPPQFRKHNIKIRKTLFFILTLPK